MPVYLQDAAADHGVPPLDSPYELSEASLAEFERDGQVVLRSVLSSDEVKAYRQRIHQAVAATPRHLPSDEEGDVYAKAFRQHMNLWRAHEAVSRFSLAQRLGGVAAKLLGVDGVRIYHDQALFKDAGGGRTPWHQDMHYWPLDTDRAITMWMPLVDLTSEMGELVFAAGSHRMGLVSDLAISDAADGVFEAYIAEHSLPLKSTGRMAVGDASFHSGMMIHSALPNTTSTTREVMTVIWIADGAHVTEPANDGQRDDLRTWLPGCAPGELAASPINPIVYRKPS